MRSSIKYLLVMVVVTANSVEQASACYERVEPPVYDNNNCRLQLRVSPSGENNGLRINATTNYRVGTNQNQFSVMDDDGIASLITLYNVWAQDGLIDRNESSSLSISNFQGRLLNQALLMLDSASTSRVAANTTRIAELRSRRSEEVSAVERTTRAAAVENASSELTFQKSLAERAVKQTDEQIQESTDKVAFYNSIAPDVTNLRSLLSARSPDRLPANFMGSVRNLLQEIAPQFENLGYGMAFSSTAAAAALDPNAPRTASRRSRGKPATLCRESQNLATIRCEPAIMSGLARQFCARDLATGALRVPDPASVNANTVCPNGTTIELTEETSAPARTPTGPEAIGN